MYRADREQEYTRLLTLYNIPSVTAILRHKGRRIRINIDTDSGIYWANQGQARIIFGKFRY